jgi:hypothetical protein
MSEASHTAAAGSPPHTAGNDVSLSDLAHVLWRRKFVILACTVLLAVGGVGFSLHNTRYVSEGLLLLPSMSVADYKRYESALFNEPRLRDFLKRSGKTGSPQSYVIKRLIEDRTRLTQAVRPEFAYTERDARQYGVRIDGETELLGFRLELRESENVGESSLEMLAEYVRDTAIRVDLEARLLRWCNTYETREVELRSEQLDGEFAIQQQRTKAEGLRAIVAHTPGVGALDTRQVVSLEAGGERFLSPLAQVVAAEVTMTEHELAQDARERNLGLAQIKRVYYCNAREALTRPVTGRAFLESLQQLSDESVAGISLPDYVIERARNTFEVQKRRWNNTYLESMRFITSPQGALVRVRKPSPLVGAIVGAALGAMLGAGLALLFAWWRRNRAAIVADEE